METAHEVNVVVVLTSHNQRDTITRCIHKLQEGEPYPTSILVVDDHSEPDQVPTSGTPGVVVISAGEKRGRSSTRNQGIRKALDMGADCIIFMDGDTMPEDKSFVRSHIRALQRGGAPGRLIFSTRRHIPNPQLTCVRPPSDYLTANMDNLFSGSPMTSQDLRVVSGTVSAYAGAASFDEKCDLILSGMVTWSCNFSLDKEAATKLNAFMVSSYGLDGWFDDTAFASGWGYEDVAMGLDSLFAGIDVHLLDGPRVLHQMHDRTDDLHSHIQGRHRIMERYRKLLSSTDRLLSSRMLGSHAKSLVMAGGVVAYTDRSRVYLNGRMFTVPAESLSKLDHTVLSLGKRIFVDGVELNTSTGTYTRSLVGMLLNWAATRR